MQAVALAAGARRQLRGPEPWIPAELCRHQAGGAAPCAGRAGCGSGRAGCGGGTTTTTTMSEAAVADTRRLNAKPQDLTDAYGPPSNFLEIDIFNPQTVGMGRARYTSYELRMRTNLPIFKLKESCVRRRYSDFEWLKNELERDSKIVVPPLPGKALKRQLPFRGDEGIFEESFIEERRQGLEQFINKIAGHPLAQNERCLHMFLQEETIDRNYVPGKVRQ
ncbi:sorting nexin-12 [Pezoporus occidentalis]|uniref:sorting nexin-12 n=1 Tax=Pezoporus occidentalis TaxID=407982 RepID=UPI002F9081DA